MPTQQLQLKDQDEEQDFKEWIEDLSDEKLLQWYDRFKKGISPTMLIYSKLTDEDKDNPEPISLLEKEIDKRFGKDITKLL